MGAFQGKKDRIRSDTEISHVSHCFVMRTCQRGAKNLMEMYEQKRRKAQWLNTRVKTTANPTKILHLKWLLRKILVHSSHCCHAFDKNRTFFIWWTWMLYILCIMSAPPMTFPAGFFVHSKKKSLIICWENVKDRLGYCYRDPILG